MTEHTPVALVTGATGGMGQEIVTELSRTHHVIAVGRNEARLAALAADIAAGSAESAPARIETWQLDLSDPAAVGTRIAALDRLDVLVHAAAISRNYRVDAATPADWAEHFAVNVTAPAELTRLSLPLLRDSEGTIVFIGSGAGTKPVPGNVVYSASKYALRGLADALRIEEEPQRVRVVTLAPGQTDTEMLRGLVPAEQYESGRYIQPSSVAGVVRFLVDAPADVQITDVAVRPRQEIVRL
ncbi:NADP-dependent 3-hydroxy acid dehydrogenase YdfG [Leucobacter luti]|uniref:SDR family oxidoreductase n=1 Tax=Leucobacter luti TaxID=340320 RepID=UPI0010495ABC|nr:SDR family oxidoreductase [Leucobacter luti]MCW2289616.1 NADP-dependent 3-hydroxy acid dehydrogenase YdfG [Leucobacter luti]TCK37788.1 NADP-dependent 3-hydroxy acid dehydrogenase YdfG [Leucobacter luti]